MDEEPDIYEIMLATMAFILTIALLAWLYWHVKRKDGELRSGWQPASEIHKDRWSSDYAWFLRRKPWW